MVALNQKIGLTTENFRSSKPKIISGVEFIVIQHGMKEDIEYIFLVLRIKHSRPRSEMGCIYIISFFKRSLLLYRHKFFFINDEHQGKGRKRFGVLHQLVTGLRGKCERGRMPLKNKWCPRTVLEPNKTIITQKHKTAPPTGESSL